jgi:SAM-dependent methyltransferase
MLRLLSRRRTDLKPDATTDAQQTSTPPPDTGQSFPRTAETDEGAAAAEGVAEVVDDGTAPAEAPTDAATGGADRVPPDGARQVRTAWERIEIEVESADDAASAADDGAVNGTAQALRAEGGEGGEDAEGGASALYFMDSATEGDRLEDKLDGPRVREQLVALGLTSGMSALDIGCGPGAVTRLMAQLAAPAQVVGVDASPSRLRQAQDLASAAGLASSITFLVGEATALPVEDRRFAFAHARMVLQYAADPAAVIAEMIRATAPGGIVALVDLDGQIERLYPMDAALSADLADALAILGEYHFDPRVGRKLYSLCVQVGLVGIKVTQEPYQTYCGGDLSPRDERNWREKLATATAFLGRVTGDPARWADFGKRYLAALHAPDAFYYATLVLATARRPQENG